MTEYAPDARPLPVFSNNDFRYIIENPTQQKLDIGKEPHDIVLIQEQMDKNQNPGTLRELFFASSSRPDGEWTQHTVHFASVFEYIADVPYGDRTRQINMMVTQLRKTYNDTRLGFIYGDQPGELVGLKAPILKGVTADIYLDMHRDTPSQWVWRTEVTNSTAENEVDEKSLFVHNALVLFARMNTFTANVQHDENTTDAPYEIRISAHTSEEDTDQEMRFLSIFINAFLPYSELDSKNVPSLDSFIDFHDLAINYSMLSDEQIERAAHACIRSKLSMQKRLGIVADVTSTDVEVHLLQVKLGKL